MENKNIFYTSVYDKIDFVFIIIHKQKLGKIHYFMKSFLVQILTKMYISTYYNDFHNYYVLIKQNINHRIEIFNITYL